MADESPMVEPYWANELETIKNRNQEILQLKEQLHQFKLAVTECEKVKEDIKNKVIMKVLMPTIGNNFIQINAQNEKYIKMLDERKKQFETSMKGVKEQIVHREDLLNESLLKFYIYLKKYIKAQGLSVPEEVEKI